MEGLNNEPTSLLNDYLDQLKNKLSDASLSAVARKKFLEKNIAEYIWYLDMRRMAESQDRQDLDAFQTELEKKVDNIRNIDRYHLLEGSFGWSDGSDDPKFTIPDLEEFLKEVKKINA